MKILLKDLLAGFIVLVLTVSITLLQSCSKADGVDSSAAYMNDSTLTDTQKREMALADHVKSNPILFEMIYDNRKIPSIVDDFSNIDVVKMNYDSMEYLIVRSKYTNDHFEVINITKDKAMIEFFKNNTGKKSTSNYYPYSTKEQDKSIYGTDITKGYFDRN